MKENSIKMGLYLGALFIGIISFYFGAWYNNAIGSLCMATFAIGLFKSDGGKKEWDYLIK